ncbi:RNA methyltransferase [Jeotgalibacillus salarius]|uniref:RNA methyltransferase n=2 Tax=Jeotgalibacillus salarius TaxID=546023 RepID=A0A4Y8LE18_9BACL|nr:RNA methyltransferase [Jeotgalibacillus salarius]
MEMRALFGTHTQGKTLKTDVNIDPSRSPFIKERIEVLFEGNDLQDLYDQLHLINMQDDTFKVLFVKINDQTGPGKVEYDEKRQIERDTGMHITGELDLHEPDITFGLVPYEDRWYLGIYTKAEPVWLNHVKKPREYSTALGTRTARAIANIAVPDPAGKKAIDPCCGIGTVLVEALSMGINIDGRDINPLVVEGSRENIKYFGFTGNVTLGAIADVQDTYDATIIDLPYNLYTHATPEDQLAILKNARHFTRKLVLVTIENIDHMITQAGFTVKDRCIAKKGKASAFSREILVCE